MMNDSRNSPAAPAARSGATTEAKHHWRPWQRWLLIVAILLLVGYFAIVRPLTRSAGPVSARTGFGAVPVSAEPARKADLNVRIIALGTVTPVSTVTVRSRVDGQLQKIFFEEGHAVEAGAPLVEIDPRPF